MKEHQADLSPACKEHLEKMAAQGKRFMQVCRADMQKLCTDVKPGQGRSWSCIKSHEADLSPDCKAFVAGQ